MMDLYQKWFELAEKYTPDHNLVEELFSELITSYSEEGRYYHNVHHIKALLALSDEYAPVLEKKEVVDLAIFYHDVVYRPGMQDNEHQSAVVAKKALSQLGLSNEVIDDVKMFILITQKHQPDTTNAPTDLLYFLDFDLSILGADPQAYSSYAAAVRKEFHFVQDAAFAMGRSAFLSSLLVKPFIFFTEAFRNKYETRARQNIQSEIESLRPKY